MSYCSERGYKVGDLFKVTRVDASMREFLTEGMILKLNYDDLTDQPRFSYVSGDHASFTESVKHSIWCSLDDVEKIEQQQNEQEVKMYSIQDIKDAFKKLEWLDVSENMLIETLKELSDPEYKEYQRLKAKFG